MRILSTADDYLVYCPCLLPLSTALVYCPCLLPILLCMQGDVSFDNIGRALLQVLQVVSLESWSTTQMYYLLDGIGNVVVIYYFCLIVIGTYFALNLLVAVISAKFAQLHVSCPLFCTSIPVSWHHNAAALRI